MYFIYRIRIPSIFKKGEYLTYVHMYSTRIVCQVLFNNGLSFILDKYLLNVIDCLMGVK